ncbi:MAG TPA: flagellar basal body protein [Ideonella sp.]|nr:flagellar basal body protein [Ideonella sp.]
MNLGLFSTPLSGARAQLQRLDAAANNIANAQTLGYRRQLAQAESTSPAGVQVHISQAASQGPALAQDMVDTLDAGNSFMLDIGVLKRQDQALGSLLDVMA